MKNLFAATLVITSVLSTCIAQATPPADAVTRTVRAEMAKQPIPGLALLVARNGVPIRTQGFGLASLELDASVNYRLENGQIKNQEWVSPSANSTADGSLYFTILDLAKWDAALYSEKVLKESSKREMWTVATLRDGKPNPGSYGFAWFADSRNGHRLVGHGGRGRASRHTSRDIWMTGSLL